ncbi:ketopantoate reductase family protein [Pararhizobium qamdonense]|uniref:ketopantoate reductase family protein n=1 Tax=Pararhizobium qamdonense TaxID=3031126 RepID=UPI0023E2CE80|nr:2-dehydropantoate 2-reductase [Pararhizobium qamdonense]
MAEPSKNRHDYPQICVAGAGAIGITITARLHLAGYRVGMIARGVTLAFIQQHGIELIDLDGSHRARPDVATAAEHSRADILFLCPKSHDLPALAESVSHLITPHTTVVPVINGIPWWYFDGIDGKWNGRRIEAVDPHGVLKQTIPSSLIIGTTTMITAERTHLGTARTFNPLQMTVGELDDSPSDRLDQLAVILSKAGIASRKAPRIRNAIWTKVVRNLISNPVTAITGATLRQNFGNSYLVGISRQMLQEVLPVIAAHNAVLEVDPETILESGRKLGDVKTSMLQDLERGNELELASICDAVIELGRFYGIDMPVTQAISNLAHFKSSPGKDAFAA